MKHLHNKPKVYNFHLPAILVIVFLIALMTITSHGHEIETVTVDVDFSVMFEESHNIDDVLAYCEFMDGIYDPNLDECEIKVLVSET